MNEWDEPADEFPDGRGRKNDTIYNEPGTQFFWDFRNPEAAAHFFIFNADPRCGWDFHLSRTMLPAMPAEHQCRGIATLTAFKITDLQVAMRSTSAGPLLAICAGCVDTHSDTTWTQAATIARAHGMQP